MTRSTTCPVASLRRRQVLAWLTTVLAWALLAGCVPPGLRSMRHGAEIRREIFAALTPSKLANCALKRYGDQRDGGYLMCENLMADAQAAYSYGIDGRDQWGCAVSQQLATAVHEYDCFNTTRPACEGGAFLFHEECIGDRKTIQEGRPFDALSGHLARNGDADKHLIVKMDVEGAEWASLLATPDSVLALIDQLVVEFHGTDDATFAAAVEKLGRSFYVAHFHANNHACTRGIQPFTSWANEVLFVNKRIGVLDAAGDRLTLPNALDRPNTASHRDCQPTF